MIERKDLRTSSKKGDTWSRTQKEPVRKMSDDGARYSEREEKEVETRGWTLKEPERKKSDDENRRLEREEKEEEVET